MEGRKARQAGGVLILVHGWLLLVMTMSLKFSCTFTVRFEGKTGYGDFSLYISKADCLLKA